MHLKTLTSHIVLLTVKNILCDSCELRSLSSLYFVLSTLRVFSISLHIILCFVTVKNCMHFVNLARSKTLRVFYSTAMSRIFNSKKTTPRCVNSVHSVHCILFCGMRLKTLHIFLFVPFHSTVLCSFGSLGVSATTGTLLDSLKPL